MGITEAVIGGVSALGAAGMGLAGANEQADAARSAAQTQWRMYVQNREDMAPWREAGQKALGEYEKLLYQGPPKYTETPGYQFRFGEGLRAIDAAASRGDLGGFGSGAHKKAILRYGQDHATVEFENSLNRYYRRLNAIALPAQIGQTAAAQTGEFGQATAARMGAYQTALGNAKASAYNTLGNIGLWGADQYMQYQAMQNMNNMFGGGNRGVQEKVLESWDFIPDGPSTSGPGWTKQSFILGGNV